MGKHLEPDLSKFCPDCGHQGMVKRPDTDRAPSGNVRWKCKKCRSRTTRPASAPPQILPKMKIGEIKKSNFFVITSAVNDSPIVEGAHETWKQLAKENNGRYLVIPTHYKNPDMFHQGVTNGYTWPSEILPYVCDRDFKLNDSIYIRASMKIGHTAINPLSGMNHAGDKRSEIYGHPQVAMEMVATPKSKNPKMMHTTGSISAPAYGGSKQAKKAEFHHSLAAVIVETEGNRFWTREVYFDGKGAYDLNRYYTPKGSRKAPPAEAIVYGDVHVRSLTKRTELMIDLADSVFRPKRRILHDLHDHHIGSHHNAKDVIFGLRKAHAGEFSIRDELMLSIRYLERRNNCYVVDSNHNRHLDQWFNRFKPVNDPVNAPLYFELGELIRKDIAKGGDGNAFRCFIQNETKSKIQFIGPNDDFQVAGIDCSQHGDRGPNGARGSAKAFAKSGCKTFMGHVHSPCIEKGCYAVGVMSPDLEYAAGFGSWMNTHGTIYPNGKRCLWSIVDGKLSPSMRKAA